MKKAYEADNDTPLTPEQETEMMTSASRRYVSDRMQAKHVTKLINDEGIDVPGRQAIHGTTHDPHMRDMVENATAPVPTQSPVPGQDMNELSARLRAEHQARPDSGDTPIYEESKTMPGAFKEAGFAEENLQWADLIPGINIEDSAQPGQGSTTAGDLGIHPVPENAFDGQELPRVRSQNTIQEKLVEAGLMKDIPTAYSKSELDRTFKGAAEGTVVGIVDGRRFMKEDGKWMETPYSEAHTKEIADQRIESLANYLTRKGSNPDAQGKVLGDALKVMTPGMRAKALNKLGADNIPERLGFGLGLTQEAIVGEAIESMDAAGERMDAKEALAERNKQLNDKLKSLSGESVPKATVKQVEAAAAAPAPVQERIAQAPPEADTDALLVNSWFENPMMIKAHSQATEIKTPDAAKKVEIGDFFKVDGKFYYKADNDKYYPAPEGPPPNQEALGPQRGGPAPSSSVMDAGIGIPQQQPSVDIGMYDNLIR
jgi:hypothetical protein